MTTPTDIRIRRPQAHEVLVQQLVTEGSFPTMRDVLVLAAAVGFRVQRRVPFTATAGDPIRYDTIINSAYAETLINMIATAEVSDPEILDATRLDERVGIFEEYANGGLEYIQEQANVRQRQAEGVVSELVSEALYANSGAEPLSVAELLQGVSWG